MKVVILSGGFGTRISEESQFKPKHMIEIGGIPILVQKYGIHTFHLGLRERVAAKEQPELS